MGEEERLAVAKVAAILADLLSENHHQFVGGSLKATNRVRQLDEALRVLKRPAATPKGGD